VLVHAPRPRRNRDFVAMRDPVLEGLNTTGVLSLRTSARQSRFERFLNTPMSMF